MSNYLLSHTGTQIDAGIDAALNIISRVGTSGPASYRNKLGNCSFLVNQMGMSFTVAPGTELLSTTDLWGVQNATNQPLTVTIEPYDLYSRRVNGMKLSFATAPTAGEVYVYQRIENCNTLAGSPVCLSVNMVSLDNVSITPNLRQVFGSGGAADSLTYLSSFTVSGSGFTRYAANGSLPATSGKEPGASNFLQLTMPIPIRSTNPFYLALPQLEEGINPTPVEFVEDWIDFARCLRRYWSFAGVPIPGYLDTSSSTNRFINIPFPVPMRSVPSIITTGNYTWTPAKLVRSFVTLTCAVGNSNNQATLNSLIADARL